MGIKYSYYILHLSIGKIQYESDTSFFLNVVILNQGKDLLLKNTIHLSIVKIQYKSDNFESRQRFFVEKHNKISQHGRLDFPY